MNRCRYHAKRRRLVVDTLEALEPRALLTASPALIGTSQVEPLVVLVSTPAPTSSVSDAGTGTVGSSSVDSPVVAPANAVTGPSASVATVASSVAPASTGINGSDHNSSARFNSGGGTSDSGSPAAMMSSSATPAADNPPPQDPVPDPPKTPAQLQQEIADLEQTLDRNLQTRDGLSQHVYAGFQLLIENGSRQGSLYSQLFWLDQSTPEGAADAAVLEGQLAQYIEQAARIGSLIGADMDEIRRIDQLNEVIQQAIDATIQELNMPRV